MVVVGVVVVVVEGDVVVVVLGGSVDVVVGVLAAGFTSTTSDHLPQVSVTLPLTCPAAVSRKNQ